MSLARKLSAMISAISLSEHSVEIVSAGFVTQDGARRQMTLGRAQGSELPGTISPRAKKVWLIEADEFVRAGFDGYTPIVGSVEHATGTRFLSEPEMLGPANTLVAMLLKHRYQSGFGQRRLNAVDVLVPFGRKHRLRTRDDLPSERFVRYARL
jgi:hypothetical protein